MGLIISAFGLLRKKKAIANGFRGRSVHGWDEWDEWDEWGENAGKASSFIEDRGRTVVRWHNA